MSMNETQLSDVELLCSEVIKLIVEVRREIKAKEQEMEEWQKKNPDWPKPHPNYSTTPNPSVNTGALRRRSMDLTRALAQLRKS